MYVDKEILDFIIIFLAIFVILSFLSMMYYICKLMSDYPVTLMLVKVCNQVRANFFRPKNVLFSFLFWMKSVQHKFSFIF